LHKDVSGQGYCEQSICVERDYDFICTTKTFVFLSITMSNSKQLWKTATTFCNSIPKHTHISEQFFVWE